MILFNQGYMISSCIDLTMTHAFFSIMGGFVITDRERVPNHVLVLNSRHQDIDYYMDQVKTVVSVDNDIKDRLNILATAFIKAPITNNLVGGRPGAYSEPTDTIGVLDQITSTLMTAISKIMSQYEFLSVLPFGKTAIKSWAIDMAIEEVETVFSTVAGECDDEKSEDVNEKHRVRQVLHDKLEVELRKKLTERLQNRRKILEKDILDKNKQDSLAKTFALGQTIWFVLQCIVRRAQHLPLTQIELMTCAYATLNAAIYFFWWHKPFRVDSPIMLRSEIPPCKEWEDGTSELNLWDWDFMTFVQFLLGTAYDDYDFRQKLRVPTFYSGHFYNADNNLWIVLAEIITAAVFGGIHLLAWNYEFPTRAELWLWRVSALIIAGIPVMFFLSLILMIADTSVNGNEDDNHAGYWRPAFLTTNFAPGIFILYIITRPVILVLALISLRKLPVGTLSDVGWLKFIPHIE
ncbi:hypothetical protein Clacol_001003 [Clathrus columnatus]|uniref:Uncharacterized protein n=1 Tax=Clathrus columnatus TaxID=1419009 RepID=A0AAV5A086_9AGAM|nr:hypothetical protein Clacol_001003 [Clathrus columnatus]